MSAEQVVRVMDHAKRLLTIIEEQVRKVTAAKGKVNDAIFQVVTHAALERCREMLASCIHLAQGGFFRGAAILSRVIFETAITVLYIKEDVDIRCDLFVSYGIVQQKAMLQALRKHSNEYQEVLDGLDPEKVAQIEGEFEKIKHRFPNPYSWSGKRIRGIAIAVGGEKEYDIIYSFLSNEAHSLSLAVQQYLSEGPGGAIVLQSGDDPENSVPALAGAFAWSLLVASLHDELFELGNEKVLLAVKASLEQAG